MITFGRAAAVLIAALPLVHGAALVSRQDVNATCSLIAAAISSSSAVSYPGTAQYEADVFHVYSTSRQESTCTVETGTAEDVAIVMGIIAASDVPFAVKSGGHAGNQGWSSTPGILIALARLNSVVHDVAANAVEIGTGATWDLVYKTLEDTNSGVMVTGARAPGLGVGGFCLGGGYSWLAQQAGLCIDNIKSFDIVLPTGEITVASETLNADLFWAVKGSGNNYGIVTKLVLQAHPHDALIWAGNIVYSPNDTRAVYEAFKRFSLNNTDVKAQALMSFVFIDNLYPLTFISLYYDSTDLPEGDANPFKELFAFTPVQGGWGRQKFSDFITGVDFGMLTGANTIRGAQNTVGLRKVTPAIIDLTYDQIIYWNTLAKDKFPHIINLAVSPFLDTIHDKAKPAAFPHGYDAPYTPLSIHYTWHNATDDDFYLDALKKTAETFTAAAIADGQDIGGPNGEDNIVYPNYARPYWPLKNIYGSNVDRMALIAAKYDPLGVMKRTGGFHV